MAINASVITNTAKDTTKRTVVDYGAGVFAHTTQDWAKHNQVRLYSSTPFVAGGAVAATMSLRLLATRDDGSTLGQERVLLIPINPVGTSVLTTSPPIIIQQPANKTAPPTTAVQVQVAAISDIPITYQWQKLIGVTWTNITGQRATNLVLTGVTAAADNGQYRVVVTNANGSVTSSSMTLTIVAGASGSIDSSGWYESLPGFQLFNFF